MFESCPRNQSEKRQVLIHKATDVFSYNIYRAGMVEW